MKKKNKSVVTNGKLAHVPDKDLLSFTETQMKVYGTEVNLERSVPDFRDGLKPVQRRLLWATHQLPGEGIFKSARIVGDVIGKYHPHSDQSIYQAMVSQVNSPVGTFEGPGNWGTLTDSAGAMRYTNAKLSMYGRTFFGKFYTSVIDLVPNFDRSSVEALVLPSLLPNILFNGTSGIGVGINTGIPAFVPSTVLDCMVRLLGGEKLDAKDYAISLIFHNQYRGLVKRNKAGMKEAVAFFKAAKGSITWTSPLTVDADKKIILVDKFAPNVDPIKMIDTVKAMTEVKQAIGSKGLSWTIEARKDLNGNDFQALVKKIERLTTKKVAYNIYVTERVIVENPDKVEYKVNFFHCSVPELMQRWLKWRCKLEARMLDFRIEETKKDIAYAKLMIYAVDCLEQIIKVLRMKGLSSKELNAALCKAIKVTEEQANQILDLKVRQLSNLDQETLKAKKKALEALLADLILKRKDPPKQVRKFLESCKELFEQVTTQPGTYQLQVVKPRKE